MPGESDSHTETESEDGGVALSKFGSDAMDLDDESAPTSASQSPLQSSEEYGDTIGTPAHEFFESASSIANAGLHWSMAEANHNVHTHPGGAPTLPTDGSFAEALLGSVGLIPGEFNFHDEEDALDPANPYHQPFGTQQAFPHSLVDAPVTPDADEEQTSSAMPAEGTTQSTQHHMLGGFAPAPANTDAQYAGPIMALPSLNDVFGSDFLSQSAPAAEAAAIIPINEYPADYWEQTEDNMKNFRCDEFFSFWKQKYTIRTADYPPISDLASNLSKAQRPKKISVGDLEHEQCDFQGIYWSRFQTTKKEAREVRRMTYRNHRNVLPPDQPFGTRAFKANFHPNVIPSSEAYFRFQEMNMNTRPYTAHFQLRHNLAASSKNALFYSQRASDDDDDESDPEIYYGRKVMCFNSEANTIECAMDLTKPTDKTAPRLERLTTLAASDGVLVAGGLEGIYAIKSLSTTFETKPVTGVITDNQDCSTNHVQTILDRRSGLPQAVFDSNDSTIRVLDCLTNKFVRTHHFPFPVNCSVTSPDGRLRLLVGDACCPIVTDAETGEPLAKLRDHKDYGFSCAWAPDGITMATGHQDGLVQVWDARKLTKSLQTLPMEMGGCRAMAFSPAGSGTRVLVLAEPADFVHVVDAQSFQSKQEIEFFGEIAGISMPPDGSRLYIANCDPKYGGIMEFERSWTGARYTNDYRRRFQCRDEEQLSMMRRIMHLDYGDSINDRSKFDVLDRRRDEFKVGRSEATDWVPDDELEREGKMGPWGPRFRHDLGFRDLVNV